MRRGEVHLVPSATNRPLLLFLAAGLLSLVIGLATWDPAVPRSGSFLVVQLAQWAIFAISATAFLLVGNLVQDVAQLRRLAFSFLAVAGGLALLRVAPGSSALLGRLATHAVKAAHFWMLLAALAGGQLLFNRQLSWGWRIFLGAILSAVALYAFFLQRETVSNWVGVVAVAGILAWLRWPRLRWPVLLLLVVLTVSGVLSSTVYEFAGGGDEWAESGGSRLVLIGRVLEVTMRNPVTGLGPAVAVGQNLLNRNPNSTLATASGLHPFFRLLYARFGERFCARCGAGISVLSEDEIVERLVALSTAVANRPLDVCVPLFRGAKGSHRTLLEMLAQQFGPDALFVDGSPWQRQHLDPETPHDLELLAAKLGEDASAGQVRELENGARSGAGIEKDVDGAPVRRRDREGMHLRIIRGNPDPGHFGQIQEPFVNREIVVR